MATRCSCVIIGPPNPPTSCKGCLRLPSLLVLPENSVSACNEEGNVNLLEHAGDTACSISDLVFSVSSHSKGVKDLSITDGILTFTSVPELSLNTSAQIRIAASCPSKKTATFFTITIVFKNECVDKTCISCNPCTGNCLTAVTKNITSTCGASSTSDMKAESVLTGCTGGALTYKILSKPASITAATISNLGVISYSISSAPVFGIVLPIKYEITCSLFGLKSVGYLNITIPDLCIGETWDDATEKCISCTGDIVDKEADLEVNKSGVGFKNSGGAGFGFN